MGSIWDFGLKNEGVAKKGKAPGTVNLRLYGLLCIALAALLAAVFIIFMVTSQLSTSTLALLLAALIGPVFLAVIGLLLLRMAKQKK
jgi:hypothetical protein